MEQHFVILQLLKCFTIVKYSSSIKLTRKLSRVGLQSCKLRL